MVGNGSGWVRLARVWGEFRRDRGRLLLSVSRVFPGEAARVAAVSTGRGRGGFPGDLEVSVTCALLFTSSL
ncbi:hypothetical protein PSCLAVI8L_350048 [Pseudoclavibacter sp. 8L]|nr:hypothetical protein PSCLAVI8L_350048 [Pseudoclavibacter sp. 8L]